MSSSKLSPAAGAVVAASHALRDNVERRQTNSDLFPLRNEEQEGYGMYDVMLGVKHLFHNLMHRGEKHDGRPGMSLDDALTIVSIANRVRPAEARAMFLWLYSHRNDELLCDLASSMYHRVIWPTDAGTVDPRVGLNVCTSVLLRHYWWRRGLDYDQSLRPMSPTHMSGLLGMPVHETKGPGFFHRFQRNQMFVLMELWETVAERKIRDELISKGLLGG